MSSAPLIAERCGPNPTLVTASSSVATGPDALRPLADRMRPRALQEFVGQHHLLAPGKPLARFYFDSNTGLLVRMVRYSETPVGRMPVQIDYADYRDVNGLKVPYRWTLARTSGRFTIQVSEMQQNVPIDDAKFLKPEAPQEQPKASAK